MENSYTKLLYDIKQSPLKAHIVSLVTFGSSIWENNLSPKDIDLCIVFRKYNKSNSYILSKILNSYPTLNVDITIYYLDDLSRPEFFRDIGMGAFSAEYFSLGEVIVGKNIFTSIFKNIPRSIYKQSLKEKMFDYILRLRKVEVDNSDPDFKVKYFRKYISRLIIDFMLYLEIEKMENLISLTFEEVLEKANAVNLISIDNPRTQNSPCLSCYSKMLEDIEVLYKKLVYNTK